jgi:hypothetical protein
MNQNAAAGRCAGIHEILHALFDRDENAIPQAADVAGWHTGVRSRRAVQ